MKSQLEVLARAVSGVVAICGLACSTFIAANHPIQPGLCVAARIAVAMLTFRWPSIWLAGLPALMPLLGFAPWSGWIIFEEFDIAVLAAVSGAYVARTVLVCTPSPCEPPYVPPHRYTTYIRYRSAVRIGRR